MARQVPTRFVLPAQELALPGPSAIAAEHIEEQRRRRRWDRIRRLRTLRLYDVFPSVFGVKKSELAIFSRQLATFIGAGVPLNQAITVLQQETRSRKMRDVLAEIQGDLAQGMSVSESFSRFPEVFNTLYLNLVRAAELTGTLDTVLRRLDLHLTREDRASKEIRGALMYPVLVLLMAAVSVGVLVGFVLPRFAVLLAEFHAELPLGTQILLKIATFAMDYRYELIGLVVAVLVVITASQGIERGRRIRDALILRAPVVSTLARFAAIARFCRTLQTMLEAGVPISRSFDIVVASVSNRTLQRKLAPVKARMLGGEGFAGPLASAGIFPPTVIQMVRVGEETGALERFLGEAADFYENELEYRLANAIQLLEPAMLLAVGGVIGFVAISMVSAIYSLTAAIR